MPDSRGFGRHNPGTTVVRSLRLTSVPGVPELRAQRNRVLIAVYELTDGDRLKSVTATDVTAETNLTDEDVESVVRWLVDRHYLEFQSLAGDFHLTPSGSDEAEQLLSASNDAAVLTFAEREVLEAFTREMRVALDSASLDSEALADAEAQLATIEAQQHSPNPRRAIISDALRALKAAAGYVVAGVLGNTAYDAIQALMA